MPRRRYDQACSLADALDRIGERWSLLIVRELLLGPLRFSDLARAVGGAPTDVLTRRLRDLEADGVVHRAELPPPASGTVYELTEIGRELEEPLLALGRWGLHYYRIEQLAELGPGGLAGPLKILIRPTAEDRLALQMHSEGFPTWLLIEGREVEAGRGEIPDPDVVVSGPPPGVIATIVGGGGPAPGVEVAGDAGALARIAAIVELPERLREEARAAGLVADPVA